MARRLRKWAARVGGALVTLAAAGVVGFALFLAVFRLVPVPFTPLMVVRVFQGEGWSRDWVALQTLPRHVPRAVLAAEDQRFCLHRGIDLEQLGEAVADWREGGRLRGASTLSMQTTKNVFLWPGRSYVRKAIELPLTPVVELGWGKRRIAEVYLNVAEWGPGVYGIEAAAQYHFGIDATRLTENQAATLAAILPSPRDRPAAKPSKYTRQRAREIERQIGVVDASCIEGTLAR